MLRRFIKCNSQAQANARLRCVVQVIKDGTSGGAINPLQETVEFQIDSPQVATRNYTYFEWGSCKNGASNNSPVLRKYVSATNAGMPTTMPTTVCVPRVCS
jgi:hypothetical protein